MVSASAQMGENTSYSYNLTPAGDAGARQTTARGCSVLHPRGGAQESGDGFTKGCPMRGFHPGQKGRAQLRQNHANGGPVRGPGTGTSDEVPDEVPEGTFIMPTDSTQAIGEGNLAAMGGGKKVPVNLSNGEFKLPPEQVHAIGVQALDRMKDATHTPVAARGFAPGARQQAEPPLFFADGGVVDEENARRFVRVPEAIGHQPGRQQPIATAPAAASVQPSSVGFMPGTRAVFNESGKAIGDLAGQGRYGAAAGEAARAALAYLPAVADDVIGGAARAVLPGIADAGKQFLGMNNNASASELPTPAAPAPAAPPVSPGGNSAYGLGSSVPDLRKSGALPSGETAAPPPPADTPTSPTAPPGNEVAPGVYSHGRGQYSDNATDMGFAPAFTGRPNAQNMAAADALAGRQERAASVPGGFGHGAPAAAGFSGVIGQQGGNGNMWSRTPEQQRRDAEVQASSIHRPTAARGFNTLKALEAESLEGVRGANALAQEALRGENGLAQEGVRQDGSLQRESLQQAGANRRAASRDAIDQQRYGVEARAKGFEIRAAERQEKLYERYEAAKTPEEKSAIAQQIRDLSGKATNPKDDLLTVGGGQEWDSNANVMRNVPQRIFDARTRQYVDGAPAGGRPPIGENPQAIAIKNNTSMSREQKAAALAKLGY